MTRIKDTSTGVVHYVCPSKADRTLCGHDAAFYEVTLLQPLRHDFEPTAERVNCPNCAKVVCAVRNEPYNTLVADIDEATIDRGIYAAVQPDGPVQEVQP